MYAIYESIPVYNDRDAIDHSIIRRVSANTYETAALAWRLMPSTYDEDGQSTEQIFFVADAADPFKRASAPIPCGAEAGWDDIPF